MTTSPGGRELPELATVNIGVPDVYAFRASTALEREVRDTIEALDTWRQATLGAWYDDHPGLTPVWQYQRGFELACDCRPVGVADARPERPAPRGWSRNKGRSYLVPARGPVGDKARGIVDELWTGPSLTAVFRGHDVELSLLDLRTSTMRTPQVLVREYATGLYLLYQRVAPRSTPHLSEVPVSWFYAAWEDEVSTQAQVRAL